MKILINAILAKRICGGSYQITQNYIRHTEQDTGNEWYYVVSKDLFEDMQPFFEGCGSKVFVFENQPNFKRYWRTQRALWRIEKEICPDIVYSIVAPSYYRFKSQHEVMRFTHPWITHPNKYLKRILGSFGGLKLFLYNAPRIFFMKKCRYFITQSQTAKQGICRITKTSKENVCVISNTLPAYFLSVTPKPNKEIQGYHIACVAAPQKGKHLMIIPDFLTELRDRYQVTDATVYVTIPENHPLWMQIQARAEELGVGAQIRNLGYVKQSQLVDLYNRCNFCLFPSIMEVFSATLLEAMYFDLPVIASDLTFNSDVCKDAAVYFEPMNSRAAAQKFMECVNNPEQVAKMQRKGQEYIREYLNYQGHFEQSLQFFKKVIR